MESAENADFVERQKEIDAKKLLGDEAYQMVYPEKKDEALSCPKCKDYPCTKDCSFQKYPSSLVSERDKLSLALLAEQKETNRLLGELIENTKSWNWEPPKYNKEPQDSDGITKDTPYSPPYHGKFGPLT